VTPGTTFTKKEEPRAYFVTRYAENFPKPAAYRIESQLSALDYQWEEVEACTDMLKSFDEANSTIS